jgi:autotransporter translocation and assembly factor TamB
VQRLNVVLKRGGRLLAAAVGCTLLLGLVGVVALTQTERGRAWLLAELLPVIDAAVPGRLAVERIAALRPDNIELRGVRIFDPAGSEVISAQRVRVDLRVWPLLEGEFLARTVSISGARVDLTDIAEARRGLKAAFVDPDSPASAPGSTAVPHIAAARVRLERVSLRLPQLGALGQLDLVDGTVQGSFELSDAQPIIELTRARFAILHAGEPLGQLQRLIAHVPKVHERASLALGATLLGTAVSLRATGPPPWSDDAEERTLSAELAATQIEPTRWFEQLGLNTKLPEIHAPLAATLVLGGSTRALEAQLALATPGGALRLHGTLRDYRHIAWQAEAPDVEPGRIVAGLHLPQPGVVTARWSGTVDLPQPTAAGLQVSIDAETSLNHRKLLRVAARGELVENALRDAHLELTDENTRIVVDGSMQSERAGSANVQLALDARTARELLLAMGQEAPDAQGAISGRLAVSYDGALRIRGTLNGAQFETGSLRLAGFAARVQLTGAPTKLVGSAELKLAALEFGGQALQHVLLSADGGPSKYTFHARAEAPQLGSLRAQAEVAVLPDQAFRVSGHGSGWLWQQPWQLRIARTRLDLTGRVRSEGLSLGIGGQQLQLEGRYDGSRVDARLSAHAPALGKLAPLLERASSGRLRLPRLRGAASLEAELKGTTAQPRGRVHLDAQNAGVDHYPAMDLALDSTLDASAGTARVEVRADTADTEWSQPSKPTQRSGAPVGLRSHVVLQSTFTRGADWLAHWRDGQHLLELEVPRLDLDWLAALLGRPLPVQGTGSAKAAAELTDVLRVDWQAQAQLTARDGSDRVELAHTLRFADGRASVTLRAQDLHGPLLQAEAHARAPQRRTQLREWRNLLGSALETLPWSLSIDVPKRNLRDLPTFGLLASTGLPPLWFTANGAIDHVPQEEPSLALHVSAQQAAALGKVSACGRGDLSAAFDAKAAAGRLTAQLTGAQANRALLDADFSSRVALARALTGEMPTLERRQLHARIREVELASLPVICERGRGKLQFALDVDDPMGASPKATASLAVKGFSLSSETLDVNASLRADAKSGVLDASVGRKPGASQLHIAVPLHWSSGTFEVDKTRELAARLDLAALPVAPFVPDRAGVSYASGTLAGNVTLRGTFAKPEIAGQIVLRDIAFTLTDLAQPIDHINGRIRLAGREIAIENFTARDRDGTIRLSADAKLNSLQEGSGKAHVVLDKFPIRDSGEVAATVHGDLSIAAERTEHETHVLVAFNTLDTFMENLARVTSISLTPHPELVVDGVPNLLPDAHQAKERTAQGDPARRHKVLIELRTRDRIWFKRDDFALRLSMALDVLREGQQSRVTGQVLIERGFVDLFGQVFDVDPNEGKLEFSGWGVPDPIITLKAHNTNRKTGDVIGVVISGHSTKPTVKFTVNDKPVDAGAAVAAIFGAAQSGSFDTEANTQAMSMIMGLTAGLLASAARRELGAVAPILMVDAPDEKTKTRVRAGFEFDSYVPTALRSVITGVYFEGSVGGQTSSTTSSSDNTQSGGVHPGALLELYFPYNLFTSGKYGPGNTWALDVGWQP